MKTVAIIQARVSSTRLARKVLLQVMGKPILHYIMERIRKAKFIEDMIIATSIKKEDLEIVKLVSSLGISVYCGSEEDVLDRYYQAARVFGIQHIVRITADCPLIDPSIIDNVIDLYFASGADYCSNTLDLTFPDGEDAEVFSFDALSYAWQNAKLLSEREHVTPYIRKHPDKFKLASFKNKIDLSGKRWTLDRKEDFKLIKIILESLYPLNPNFAMEDILKFLRQNPQIEDINKGILTNEGYLKSLAEDRVVNIGHPEE